MKYILENKNIWQAYTKMYTESPDTVLDPEGNKLFSWNDKSDLTSTFMRIGDQWLLAGVNIFKQNTKSGKDIMVHSHLFSKLIESEFLKILPEKLKEFDYRSAYSEGDEIAISDFIEDIIKSNKILADIYSKYSNRDDRHEFLTLIADEIANYVNPEMREFRASKKSSAFSLGTIFYKPDESLTRVWFDCGRLWINPQTQNKTTIPGLIISMWKKPDSQSKIKIQNELADILKSNGYKFSHIAWDGDDNIDPTQRHIKASKLPVNKQPTWDDIKYR
jgi:hypothetical protein